MSVGRSAHRAITPAPRRCRTFTSSSASSARRMLSSTQCDFGAQPSFSHLASPLPRPATYSRPEPALVFDLCRIATIRFSCEILPMDVLLSICRAIMGLSRHTPHRGNFRSLKGAGVRHAYRSTTYRLIREIFVPSMLTLSIKPFWSKIKA